MEKLSNQARTDAERKSHFILKHAEQYDSDIIFRSIVNRTVYLTTEETEASMKIIGGRYNKAGQFLGL